MKRPVARPAFFIASVFCRGRHRNPCRSGFSRERAASHPDVSCPAPTGSPLPFTGEGLGERALLIRHFGAALGLPGPLCFAPSGEFLLANAPKGTKRSGAHHPGLAALDFPLSIVAPRARREGPSLAHRGSRGIHAAQPLRNDSVRPSEWGNWCRTERPIRYQKWWTSFALSTLLAHSTYPTG